MSGRVTPGGMIKGILALQLLVGGILVFGDLSGDWKAPGLGRPSSPEMTQPIRPGDQTRRYRPADLPERSPASPFPPTPDMPPRLNVTEAELDGRSVLRLVGTIAGGDAERLGEDLARRLRAEEAPEAVLLNSPGGSVSDALSLGRLLRDLDARTEVVAGDVCLSACPYLLAGGVERWVDPEGAVGVHQHYFGQSTVKPAFMAVEDIQRGQGEVMAYLDEMEVDPRMMQHALVTPPSEIYIFVMEELAEYDLVTPEDVTEG